MRGVPDRQDEAHEVYVITSPDTGQCLYVGMSRDAGDRIYIHHLNHSHWTHEPYAVEIIPAADRAAARVIERDLIESMNPRDNKQHRPIGPGVPVTDLVRGSAA